MEIGTEEVERLRLAVERKAERRMETHGDYEYLSRFIFEELHQQISSTTLKRLWGKLDEPVVPRRSTLDILSQLVGAKNWDDFCQSRPKRLGDEAVAETAGEDRKTRLLWRAVLCGLAVVVAGVLFWMLYQRGHVSPDESERYILRRGQTFDTYADYLRLFGVSADEESWYRPVPHHPNMRLWGPQFRHPEWHNDGNPDSLMPIITEYWEPADSLRTDETTEVVQRMNRNGYYISRRINEVRLTFMSHLPSDTAHFVFLGVYRLSLSRSDTTRIVWERVADEVDLRNLDYLEGFRN
ncbi:MAG: hypothetical protein IJ064_04735 [Bacteroidaceae bacterium]|nr:hypothetical protein [Bacteroidaceae bacterium]